MIGALSRLRRRKTVVNRKLKRFEFPANAAAECRIEIIKTRPQPEDFMRSILHAAMQPQIMPLVFSDIHCDQQPLIKSEHRHSATSQ